MAADGRATQEERRPRRPLSPRGFYARAVSEAEREYLEQAAEVTGLDEEIALLRAKLAVAVAEHPENVDLLMRGVQLLVRAVSARYRLSPGSRQDLLDNILGVINGLNLQLSSLEESHDGDAA